MTRSFVRTLPRLSVIFVLAAAVLTTFACQKNTGGDDVLKLSRTIPLPGVDGRLGHLYFDRLRERLYIAATENHSIQIVDVKEGKVWKSHLDVGDPFAFAFISGAVPSQDSVVASLGAAKGLWVGDAETGERRLRVDFDATTGEIHYHDATSRLYVAHGDGGEGSLTAFEVNEWQRSPKLDLGAPPAGFQLETQGTNIFVNIPSASRIAVLHRETGKVLDRFDLQNVKGNHAMAFDERLGRLFVACSEPSSLLAIDTRKGGPAKEQPLLASIPCAADAGDVSCDFEKSRVYVSCGAGSIDVFEHQRPDSYARVGRVETRAGARTSLFVAPQRKLYVALPKLGDAPAEIRVYDVR